MELLLWNNGNGYKAGKVDNLWNGRNNYAGNGLNRSLIVV